MVDPDTLSVWLRNRLSDDFVSEAWIFGSVLDTDRQPNDIDIFVKYPNKNSMRIPGWRRQIQGEFSERFGLPLHILALTHSECVESASFLESSLRGAKRVR
jgi:predicted nucleotidyltransferase